MQKIIWLFQEEHGDWFKKPILAAKSKTKSIRLHILTAKADFAYGIKARDLKFLSCAWKVAGSPKAFHFLQFLYIVSILNNSME